MATWRDADITVEQRAHNMLHIGMLCSKLLDALYICWQRVTKPVDAVSAAVDRISSRDSDSTAATASYHTSGVVVEWIQAACLCLEDAMVKMNTATHRYSFKHLSVKFEIEYSRGIDSLKKTLPHLALRWLGWAGGWGHLLR